MMRIIGWLDIILDIISFIWYVKYICEDDDDYWPVISERDNDDEDGEDDDYWLVIPERDDDEDDKDDNYWLVISKRACGRCGGWSFY